jgi:adenosylhomocysteinase
METEGRLAFPVFAVNDAHSKYLFDNRFGTAQSTADAVARATNKLIAGKTAVVVGFGWCGRGIADRMKGMGANIIVVETATDYLGKDATGYHKALEALYSGYRVMNMEQAAPEGDIFITATGNKNVITKEHFAKMKDGVILANAGHFNVEIDEPALRKMSKGAREIKENLMQYTLSDGRRLNLLSDGRLVNLARPSGQGHPTEIMDGSFGIQALCVRHIAESGAKLAPGVHIVPRDIDIRVAKVCLESQGVKLRELTKEQLLYMRSSGEGT